MLSLAPLLVSLLGPDVKGSPSTVINPESPLLGMRKTLSLADVIC